MIKIAVLIPDRGDRPRFLKNCLRMMASQTLQPSFTLVVGDPPSDDKCDITKRYKAGYNAISRSFDVDLIAFIENDDFYAPDYLEVMAKEWIKAGRPSIFGTNYTIYYHIRLKKYFTMEHFDRASAMNTFIVPWLPIVWPVDEEPYTDMHLWQNCGLRGVVVKPERIISLGIKHGEGKTGGSWHSDKLNRFTYEDNGLMRMVMDDDSFNFYNNYFQS